jgi:hypothetical protein
VVVGSWPCKRLNLSTILPRLGRTREIVLAKAHADADSIALRAVAAVGTDMPAAVGNIAPARDALRRRLRSPIQLFRITSGEPSGRGAHIG